MTRQRLRVNTVMSWWAVKGHLKRGGCFGAQRTFLAGVKLHLKTITQTLVGNSVGSVLVHDSKSECCRTVNLI